MRALQGIALAALLATGGLSAPAFAATTSGNVSMDGSESTMVPRFFRSGTPGDACSTFSSGNFQYRTVEFTSDASGQMTATVDNGTCGTNVFVTFHSGTFNPASICDGYVWSFGSSQSYTGEAFAVPANTPMTMVVSGVPNAPGLNCGPVAYTINGVTPPIPKSVPTLSEWSMFLLSLLMAGGTMFYLRRKTTDAQAA